MDWKVIDQSVLGTDLPFAAERHGQAPPTLSVFATSNNVTA